MPRQLWAHASDQFLGQPLSISMLGSQADLVGRHIREMSISMKIGNGNLEFGMASCPTVEIRHNNNNNNNNNNNHTGTSSGM